MDHAGLPKNEDVFFAKLIAHAVLARLYIGVLSVLLIAAAFTFNAPRDQAMFGVTFLPVGPSFFVAGVAGLVTFMSRAWRVTVVWVALLGLACVGRMVSVVFSNDFTAGERLRSTIWFVVWLGALVCVVNVQAAKVLRRVLPGLADGGGDDPWSG